MQTEDEARTEYLQIMGPDLGQWYYDLDREADWLRQKWNVLNELFNKGPERLEMLNIASSSFFHILNRLLFDDAMLHLCRLTDPPKNRHRENLTIMRLPEAISDASLNASVTSAAAQFKKECDFARTWRDKQIAHNDLKFHQSGNLGLPNVESKNIEAAIHRLGELLNLIREHFLLPPSILFLADPGGVESLVSYLKEGITSIGRVTVDH